MNYISALKSVLATPKGAASLFFVVLACAAMFIVPLFTDNSMLLCILYFLCSMVSLEMVKELSGMVRNTMDKAASKKQRG